MSLRETYFSRQVLLIFFPMLDLFCLALMSVDMSLFADPLVYIRVCVLCDVYLSFVKRMEPDVEQGDALHSILLFLLSLLLLSPHVKRVPYPYEHRLWNLKYKLE